MGNDGNILSIDQIVGKLNEIREKLPVNQYMLELECINQPVLYAEVGDLASEARSIVKGLKDRLDFVKASLSLKIRTAPDKYGIAGKATEDSIGSAVVVSEEYQQANSELLKAMRISDALNVLQTSVEQRKSMIKDLVSLFIYNYYSDQNRQNMGSDQAAAGNVTKEMIIRQRQENASKRRVEFDEEEEL